MTGPSAGVRIVVAVVVGAEVNTDLDFYVCVF